MTDFTFVSTTASSPDMPLVKRTGLAHHRLQVLDAIMEFPPDQRLQTFAEDPSLFTMLGDLLTDYSDLRDASLMLRDAMRADEATRMVTGVWASESFLHAVDAVDVADGS